VVFEVLRVCGKCIDCFATGSGTQSKGRAVRLSSETLSHPKEHVTAPASELHFILAKQDGDWHYQGILHF
jgi:hypothetical protein